MPLFAFQRSLELIDLADYAFSTPRYTSTPAPTLSRIDTTATTTNIGFSPMTSTTSFCSIPFTSVRKQKKKQGSRLALRGLFSYSLHLDSITCVEWRQLIAPESA